MENRILGIYFHRYSLEEILEKVKNCVDSGKKLQIITLNTEMIIRAQKDKGFKDVIASAGLIVPESVGLQLAWQKKNSKGSLKLLTSGLKVVSGKGLTDPLTIIPGVDLALFIAGICEEFNYRLLLFGGKEGVADEAKGSLKHRFPKLDVASISGGLVDGSSREDLIKSINKVEADVIFVALGHPKQEKWIAENLPKLNCSVAVGIGGALDFWSRRVGRAPVVVRSLGMEWAFRLIRQPWRASRQFSLLKFLLLVSKD